MVVLFINTTQADEKSYSLFIEWNTMKQLKPMNYQYLQNTAYQVKKLRMKEYIFYYSTYIKL